MYNTTFRERPPRNGENKKRAGGIKVKWNNKTLDAPSIIYNEGCKLKGHKIEVIK